MNDMKDVASRLRERVTLQSRQLTDAGDGQFNESWSDLATVWAAVEPVESRLLTVETMAQEQLRSAPMYRITMRYREDVNADMRISYRGRVFNIRSVTSPQERREFLQILAEENAAT